MYAVTVEPLGAIFFLTERPEGDRWDVREGVEIDIPANLHDGPDGTTGAEQVLAVAIADPRRYKVFRHPRDIDPAEFRRAGRHFGGVFSKNSWARFAKQIPAKLATLAGPADEPPGATDAALRALKEGR